MPPAIAPAANEPRIELELDESFHRIKRTLILLSSTLILLGCTSPELVKVATGMDPELRPSLAALRAFMLIAATYYAWGFGHEVVRARRKNMEVLDPGRLRALEGQLQGLIGRYEQLADKFDLAFPEIRQRLEDAVDLANRTQTDPIKNAKSEIAAGYQGLVVDTLPAPHNDPAHDPAKFEMLKTAIESGFNLMSVLGKQRQVATVAKLDEISAYMKLIEGEVGILTGWARKAADRMRLHRGIYRDRSIAFYGWECVGAYVTFVLALLFTLTPVGFPVAELIEKIATVS